MKKLIVCCLMPVITACNSHAANLNINQGIMNTFPFDSSIINENFESGSLSTGLRQSIDGNGSLSVVNDPIHNGNHALRFSVPNDGVSYRAEVAGYPVHWGTYRYQFSLYIPKDWQQTHLETILAQWHGSKLSNGQNTNPPISLSVQDDHWRLAVHQLTSDTTVSEKGFVLPKIATGVWNHFDVRIHWSTPNSPGNITIYNNNQLWLDYTGINNYYQKNAPYFKMGIYRPHWNPAKQFPYTVGGMPVSVYGDNIKITKIRDSMQ